MKQDKSITLLVRRAQHQDVDAYGQLVAQCQEQLYKTAFLYTKNEQDSLDLVQECILKGFRSIHKLKEPEYFQTWMVRILMNLAKDYYRKLVYTEDVTELEVEEVTAGISKEMEMDLYDAIDRLPDKYRMIVILKYFNELTLQQIAETLGIPQGSVSAYLTRAKVMLREQLKEG